MAFTTPIQTPTPVAFRPDGAPAGTQPSADTAPAVIPCIRLFTECVFRDDPFTGELIEAEVPVIALAFEYPSLRARVRASDPKERFFVAARGGVRAVGRNVGAEEEARRILEGFGAVELDCLADTSVSPDVDADYLVRVEGDSHEHCAFSRLALPVLERKGWKVEIDRKYPFQIVQQEGVWYANVREDDSRADWFALELGVEIGGRRVDMLPALLGLLEGASEGDSLGELQRKRTVALPIDATHHITVEGEQLRSLLRVVIELYEGTGDFALRFPLQASFALEGLDEAFARLGSELRWSDPSGVRGAARALGTPPKSVEEPGELKATLRPYQRAGLAWLQHLRANGVGGILADDMGLGKTLQTIAHITTEVAAGRATEPCLVVAPTSLMGNWARELRKFAPHLSVVTYHGPKRAKLRSRLSEADVVLTSYPLLVRDEDVLSAQSWYLEILDEAQVIKNPRSRSHKSACALSAEHRLCLTGTPVENHLGELFALFEFLDAGRLGSPAFFREWYRTPIEKFGDTDRLLALHERISPFILRRLKSEVATELPPKTEILKPVELSGKQRELYESIRIAAHTKVRSEIKKKGFAASTIAILDALMKLRQLCCDPRLVKMDAARFVRESAKRDALFELLDAQLPAGHRILIFSQFTSMLSLISQGLRERKIKHLTLTGATKDRQALCDRFEAGEADVFLISLKAGGTGLNLTSADTVIHYDPWWNPQAQAQATDRAYRIGQTKPVFVYSLYVSGSVEERMLRLQRKKRRLADAILAGELPEDSGLNPEDVEKLLAPL